LLQSVYDLVLSDSFLVSHFTVSTVSFLAITTRFEQV
jgi:hypothetical protein